MKQLVSEGDFSWRRPLSTSGAADFISVLPVSQVGSLVMERQGQLHGPRDTILYALREVGLSPG
jgi:hypothetical protein